MGLGSVRPAGENPQGGSFSAPLPPPSTERAHKRAHQGAVHLPAAPGPARSSSPSLVAWTSERLARGGPGGDRAPRSRVPTCAQGSRCGRCAARCAVSAAGGGVGGLSPGLQTSPRCPAVRSSLPLLPEGEPPTLPAGSATVPLPARA